MAETTTTFAERFAYARLVRHYRTGEAPSNAEIGRAVERTGQWVTKWAEAVEPPTDYRVHAPLADFLGVGREWLIEGKGEPPELYLWTAWLTAHRQPPPLSRVAEAKANGHVVRPPAKPQRAAPRLPGSPKPVTSESLAQKKKKGKGRRAS